MNYLNDWLGEFIKEKYTSNNYKFGRVVRKNKLISTMIYVINLMKIKNDMLEDC